MSLRETRCNHQERGCRKRESVHFIFKRKPTLASLLPFLGSAEYLNLSPSLTPSAVKMRDNLGCLLCLPCALSLWRFFLILFFFYFPQLSSPFFNWRIYSVYDSVSLNLICWLHMLIYGSLHVKWLIIAAVIITYRDNCVTVNMTEWSPPRNAVSIVNGTEA